jgi:hypothetical protein
MFLFCFKYSFCIDSTRNIFYALPLCKEDKNRRHIIISKTCFCFVSNIQFFTEFYSKYVFLLFPSAKRTRIADILDVCWRFIDSKKEDNRLKPLPYIKPKWYVSIICGYEKIKVRYVIKGTEGNTKILLMNMCQAKCIFLYFS